jgi:hypothetical protein
MAKPLILQAAQADLRFLTAPTHTTLTVGRPDPAFRWQTSDGATLLAIRADGQVELGPAIDGLDEASRWFWTFVGAVNPLAAVVAQLEAENARLRAQLSPDA